MNEIQATARLKIHEGKLEKFKEIADACIKCVQEKDKGTLKYEWFINADGSECVVKEKYVDSNAVMEHSGNLGDLLGTLLSITDLSLDIFGNPSEDLMSALDGLDVTVYQQLGTI